MTSRRIAALLAALAAGTAFANQIGGGEPPSASDLVGRSIAHHDPQGLWGRARLRLSFDETRPDGPSRTTVVELDPRRQRFAWSSRRGDDLLEGTLAGADCALALNGSSDISAADRDRHRLTCERLELYRDYYGYLWGLPMKLLDDGTRLAPAVEHATFEERSVLALRVTYDPAVGSDIWDFYFDPDSAALVGYRFVHDEGTGDGEYIPLSGEVAAHGLRLPQTRTWFTNADSRHLGTDTLTDLELLDTGN